MTPADAGRAALAAAVGHQPTGIAFTVVLVLHVAVAVVGLGALAAGALAAAQVVRAVGGPVPGAAGRYFEGGPSRAVRVLWLVPPLGVVLLVMARGAYGAGDGWVVGGIVLWAAAAALAEGVVRPAERALGRALGAGPDVLPAAARHARRACAGGVVAAAVVLGAMVVMVAKP